MNDREKERLIAKLKESHPEETTKLQKYYEDALQRHLKTISGLREAYWKALKIPKRIAPQIPKNFKPSRAGGNPEVN